MQHSRGELASYIGSQATCDMTRGVVSVTCSRQDVCSRQDGRWSMQIAWCTRSKWTCNARAARLHAGHWVGRRRGRGVHLQAPAHAAGRRPVYCRRTACPCRLTWRLSLLPQITTMLTNERCPSKTESRGSGRTGVCRDGTLRQTRPLRDEQKQPCGPKHGSWGEQSGTEIFCSLLLLQGLAGEFCRTAALLTLLAALKETFAALPCRSRTEVLSQVCCLHQRICPSPRG
jgi:hypothetical protein